MSVINPLNPFNEQEELSAPEKELISTETSYCEQLCTLIELFADPLRAWIDNLEPDIKARQRADYQIELVKDELEDKHTTIDEALFSNIRQLHDCSKELLSALVEASKCGSKSIVMDTFRRHAPFLTMYSTYTSNFSSANVLFQRLQFDPRFSAFIKCGELQARCKGLTLPSFLILPVQRTPRYGLLINEAVRMCSDENGKQLLMATYQLTSSVTKRIDSKIEEQERRNKLILVQDALGIELLAPAREFIRDGTLTKICHSGRKDKLIYATELSGFLRSDQKYSVNKNFNLHDLLIVVPDVETDQNKNFFICSKNKAFEVEAATKEIANQWVEDIIRLKSRRTVTMLNAEQPWYINGERTSGFSLYRMDKNSVTVNTYKFHSDANLSNGIISFSEIGDIIVDDEPSALQRPQSAAGYKRLDSFHMHSSGDSGSDRGSETSVPEERRGSFSLLIKKALCGRQASSPAIGGDNNIQSRMSDPIPIIKYQFKDIDVVADRDEHLTARVDSDGDIGPVEPSGPAPRLGVIGRMNTADLKLLGSNADSSTTDTPDARSLSLKPAEPFSLKTKFSVDNFVPTRPVMPSTAPPPVPEQPKSVAADVAQVPDDSKYRSESADTLLGKHLSISIQVGTKNEKYASAPPRPKKSVPALPAPPPPAVRRPNSTALSVDNRRTAAAKIVKAATAKPKKSQGGAHSRNNSSDSSSGNKSGKKVGASPKGVLSLPIPSPPSAAPDRNLAVYPAASRLDAIVSVSPRFRNQAVGEKTKYGCTSLVVQDCIAMADAVADMHVDAAAEATPIPMQRPSTFDRRKTGDVATGNVKCTICGTILAFKIGSDPNAVVDQHIAQIHD